MHLPRISVCICTYKRPEMLRRLLQTLEQQNTAGAFSYGIVVADNDQLRSAETTVLNFAKSSRIPTIYSSEPRQNIALARNKAIAHADGDFIAFIDDDEFPDDAWLVTLLAACNRYRASGILGPVRPHFDSPPPKWIIKGRFCERPEPPTGTVMDWEKCRTGNVLFRRELIKNDPEPFHLKFGTGGEDKDFFMRMIQGGGTFFWCNEGFVFETVPPDRWTRLYMVKRAMLRGRNILKQPDGKLKLIVMSLIATPLYILVLPFSLFFGQHIFMKYCIKMCDHLGRLLTCVGLNPVSSR
jgi:succinoglycan biosynthesis protein ExoM